MLILLLGLACAPPQTPMPALDPPAWRDGEVAVYHIERDDSVLYRSRLVLRFDEELTDSPGGPDQAGRTLIPTAVVTTTVEPVMSPLFFYDSSIVVFRRDSLNSLRSYRSLETDITVLDIEARYRAGEVTIRRHGIEGVEERVLKAPAATYDNDQIRILLRSVPLVSGTRFDLNRLVAVDFRVVPAEAHVLGTKQIATELGNILCREIVLISPAKEIRLWYEIEEPHRFVGMLDSESRTEMLIVSYDPGTPDIIPEPPR